MPQELKSDHGMHQISSANCFPMVLTIDAADGLMQIGRVPKMTARALHHRHFQIPSDVSAIVQIARVKGTGEDAVYEDLSENQWDDLSEIWGALPPLILPVSEASFATYRAAFDARACEVNWELTEMYGSHNGEIALRISMAEDAHRQHLKEMVESGAIVPLSSITHLPRPKIWKATSLITLDDLTKFANSLQISVQVSDGPPPSGESHQQGRPFWRDIADTDAQRQAMLSEFRRAGGSVSVDRSQENVDDATTISSQERGTLARFVKWDGRNRKTVTAHLKRAAYSASAFATFGR